MLLQSKPFVRTVWLPSCLTRRGYSAPEESAANYSYFDAVQER